MSRIYQYPAVTEIGSDDYLALGSATNGSRSILASDLAPVIGNKTITERGTYKASDDNMDGYGQVTVDIPYTDIHVASGDIATFEGEDLPLKSLKVAVTPYQDLHGYDAPWAGGAGKNKYNYAEAQMDKSISDSTGKIVSATGYWVSNYIPVKQGDVVRVSATGSSRSSFVSSDKQTYQYYGGSYPATAPFDGYFIFVGNSSLYPYDGANVCTINNSDMTFAPYSNICPIIGWDEAVVTRCGKNFANVSADTRLTSNINVTYLDNGISLTNAVAGTYRSDFWKIIDTDAIRGETITLSMNCDGDYKRIMGRYRKADGTNIGNALFELTSATINRQLTVPSDLPDGAYLAIVFYCTANVSTTATATYTNIQIELGTTATTYEPYNGATYTIDLDGTRYGSVVDVVSGSGTDTLGFVDLGTLDWFYYTDGTNPIFYASINGIKNYLAGDTINGLCSNYKNYGRSEGRTNLTNNMPDQNFSVIRNSQSLAIRDDNYTDVTAFKTAMNGVQLVYELATPITVQLAPTPVKSIEGTNNISADCGAVDVEYQTVWVRPTN